MNADAVLIIDDDPDICEFISTVAEDCGLEPTVVSDHREFREYYRRCDPGVVVTDLQMPHIDGIEVLRFLGEEQSRAAVVVMSGFDPKVVSSAEKLGASLGLDVIGALNKPVSVVALKEVLGRARSSAPIPTVDELKVAIEKGQIQAVYQPKIEIHGGDPGRVLGFEALVRWLHPRLGTVFPDIFVPMAEQAELIDTLTDQVMDQALAHLATWRSRGHDFQMAVNLSPLSLRDLGLPDRFARKVSGAGSDPSRFVLEVTESDAMEDVSRCMDILTRFRIKGFELSIDDFGTGYSSLVQLYQMPFSELKIDKSFVMEVESSEQARVIVRALVNLAHSLSLHVCAEGIESAGVWRFLEELGCEKGQGFFMSRPLAATEVKAWLESWGSRETNTLVMDARRG